MRERFFYIWWFLIFSCFLCLKCSPMFAFSRFVFRVLQRRVLSDLASQWSDFSCRNVVDGIPAHFWLPTRKLWQYTCGTWSCYLIGGLMIYNYRNETPGVQEVRIELNKRSLISSPFKLRTWNCLKVWRNHIVKPCPKNTSSSAQVNKSLYVVGGIALKRRERYQNPLSIDLIEFCFRMRRDIPWKTVICTCENTICPRKYREKHENSRRPWYWFFKPRENETQASGHENLVTPWKSCGVLGLEVLDFRSFEFIVEAFGI